MLSDVSKIFGPVRKQASPSIRKFTETNGDAKITKIVVCRQPVTPAIERLASVISAGRWDANKKRLQYDKMWHLFLIMTLDNGKVFKLEKNKFPEITMTATTGNDIVDAPTPKSITWRDMLAGAESAAGGPEKLWVYDAITQNCQYLARAVLKAAVHGMES